MNAWGKFVYLNKAVEITILVPGSGLVMEENFNLGNVDNSGRVGDIPSGSGVASSNSGHGSVGQTSDVEGSRGAHVGVASGEGSVVVSGIGVASVAIGAKTVAVVTQTVAVGAVESVSISLGGSGGNGGQTSESLGGNKISNQ